MKNETSGAARVRVLHVVRQYAPMQGGFENYVKALCSHQRRQGLQPAVLTLNRIFHKPDNILPSQEVIDDTLVTRIPFRGARRLFVPLFNPMRLRAYDIIHVHAIDQLSDVICGSKLLFKRPVVVTTHGGFFHTDDYAALKQVYFRTISRLTLHRADAFIACSTNDKKMMQRIAIEATLIPNAVEVWGEVGAGNDLLYVGRLAANKQVDKLLEFVAALQQAGQARHLHIVGDDFDGLSAALQQQIASLGIGEHAHLHGYLSRDELQALIRRCGYFVSASRYEGFGMSMIEAMAAGLIPYVQANDSFSELIGATNPRSLTNFAEPAYAARQFIALDATIGEADRRRVRAFASQFSWPELANKVLSVYRQVCRARSGGLDAQLAAAEPLPTP
jgi:alpha-1,3-mannosyltransferase